MKLSQLHKSDKAKIIKIDTSDDLKGRLASFGVVRGSKLSIEACSARKKTMEILVDDTLIGLRASEASQIVVEKI